MSLNRYACRLTVVIFACAILAEQAAGMPAAPPVLNPKTYTSPSGEYALAVEPGTMYGEGEASYRLTRKGKVAWSGKRPFTLWEAAVADDGTVAGYAYENGPHGFAPRPGKFHVAILAPDGTTRLDETVEREDSRFIHALPNPLAGGMFLDADRKRLVVRVGNPNLSEGGETWWVYDLATGKSLAKVPPMAKEAGFQFVLRAVPVPGTPLVLLNWWHYDDNATKNPGAGAGFTLIDLADERQPKSVWKKVVLGDYAFPDAPDDPWRSDRSMEEIRRDGTILRCDEPRRFELHFVAAKERVTFEVAPPNGTPGWEVREVARAAYDGKKPPAPAPPPAPPAARLKYLGTFPLCGGKPAAPPHPVRDVADFDVDDQGRFGFVRREQDDNGRPFCSFVLVDPDGNPVVAGLRPAQDFGDKNHGSQKVAWLRAARWVVTDCESGPGGKARAWFIDVDPGAVGSAAFEKFDGAAADSIAGRTDGGFVVLGTRLEKYTGSHELACYDPRGWRRWLVGTNYADERQLFSPEGVAVDRARGDGVVVVDNLRNALQFYDGSGAYARTMSLEKAFGRKPSYPSGVAVQRDGTLVVHDFDGSPQVWRIKPDGTLLDKFEPRFQDGQKLEIRDVKLSPDDRVWTTDGKRLLRLGQDGTVDRALGAAPNDESPGRIGAIALGPQGTVYTAAGDGAAVQVHDRGGKLLRVLKPAPQDFSSSDPLHRLTVAGDGSACVAGWRGPYLRFRPDGSRVGTEKLGLDDVTETWHFVPGTSRRWVVGYEELWLVGEDGKVVREIRRQPDGNWLAKPEAVGVAPDGSAAVVATGPDDAAARLNVFAADGAPVKTVSLGASGMFPSVAFDGKRAVVSRGAQLLLVNVERASVVELEMPGSPGQQGDLSEAYWEVLFSPNGKELWALDLQRQQSRIERFEVAEPN